MPRFVCATCGSVSEVAGPCPRHDTERVETDDPLVGEDIADYRVVAVIGEGGMGRVYKAVVPSIGAQVAIKVLSHRLAGVPELAERFVAEARTANLVRHDGLVNVIGAGLLPDRRPYQIMELLHGAPLVRMLQGISLGAACKAIREALQAAAVLHGHGIVHRDLTPANLFVTLAGRIKIIDFGIAKVMAAPAMTETGQAVGTPRYMAPEQAAGAAIDHRVDLYALGVVLSECATGGRAIAAPTGVALLDDVIRTATHANPDQRFATAMEMERALTQVIDALPDDAFAPLVPAVERPETIGKYEVLAVLGRGGGGVVMLARDPDLKRRVALKLLHAKRDEQWMAEAQAMARVAHPNVVAIYEIGVIADQAFLAMEYVDGQELARWLDEPRAWQDIVKMFVEAGRGLVAAHDAGITHRDFKPSNVVIGKDGRPRVGDFGLAHEHGEQGRGGTPAYMAPEQQAGRAVDALSDQYAFCASLWEALHGALPDRSMVTVRETLPTPREIPPKLAAVVRRGLWDREARYPSMRALLAALEAASAPSKPRGWLVAGAVLAASGLGIAVLARTPATEPLMDAAQPVTGPSLIEIANAGSPGDILRTLGTLEPSMLASASVRTLGGDAAMRGPTRVIAQRGPVTAIALSDDGLRLAVATADDVTVYTGGTARSLRTPGDVRRLAFAGAAVIAMTSEGLFELGDRTITERVRCPREGIPSRLVASDRLRYIACPTDAGLRLIDRDAPGAPLDLVGNPELVFDLVAGRLLAITKMEHHVAYDLRTRRELGRVTGQSLSSLLVGDEIALTAGSQISLFHLKTKAKRTIVSDFSIRGSGVTTGAHPLLLAWSSIDNKVAIWRSSGDRAFHFEAGAITGLVIPRDRPTRLVMRRQADVVLRDLDSDRELSLAIEANEIVPSADGSTIAISHGSQVTLWFPDLRPPQVTPMPLVLFDGIAISLDGARIAHCEEAAVVLTGAERGRVAMPTGCKRVGFGGDTSLAIVDNDNAVWTRRQGQPPAKQGIVPNPISALSAVDLTHVAVFDTEMHVHWFAEGVIGRPCGTAKVSSWFRVRGITTDEGATEVCDFTTGVRHPIEGLPGARWRFSGDAARIVRLAGERVAMFRADGTREPFPELDRIVEAFVDHRGTRVVAHRREVGLVVLEAGQRMPITLAMSRNPRQFDISPDGTRVAALIDRQLRVWEIAQPERPRDLPQLPTRGLSRFRLTGDALFTLQVGIAPERDGGGMSLDRWPLDPPDAAELATWIQRVAPR